jgi:hypothetical protein
VFPGHKINASHLGEGLTHHRPLCRRDERIFGRNTLGKLLPLNQCSVFYGSLSFRIPNFAIGRDQVLAIGLPLGSG